MKILILAISRGRPLGLSATLVALRRLESERHEVNYVVRLDEDDETLSRLHATLADNAWITAVLGPRPITLGEALNATVAGRREPWDILQVIPDDIQPLSVGWDHHLALAASRQQAGSWLELNDPANPTLPFITRLWYDRVGRAFPEYFSFWFSDTWIAEVFAIAYGKAIPILREIPWFGRRGKTTNMRDIEFWTDLWIKTRQERISEAVRLAPGMPMSQIQEWSAKFEENDKWLVANVGRLQSALGDTRPPSSQYLEAKARAEAFIRRNT